MCIKTSVSEPFLEDGRWVVLIQVGLETAYIYAGNEDAAKENATEILKLLKRFVAKMLVKK